MSNLSEPLESLDEEARRVSASTGSGATAFGRLLHLAETRDSGQIRRVAQFIAATYNGQSYPFNLYELRAVDVAIGDHMLQCLDALRWGRADLHTLIQDGDASVRAAIELWGVREVSQT